MYIDLVLVFELDLEVLELEKMCQKQTEGSKIGKIGLQLEPSKPPK
jgi:hypothetical protein